MPDIELANVNNSGSLTNFQKGGIDVGDKLLSSDEIDVKIKVTDDKLIGYAKIDGSNPLTKQTWTPQDPTTIGYQEATTYYNQDTGTFDIKGSYSDVTTQIGREMHIEVVNNTASIITNGSICRHNGVAGGQVQIVLALADTFINANVLGVATHDIPSGSKGLLTTFGLVGGVDTTALAVGVPLYLSDTVAGSFTSVAPEILSRIGGALTQDALTGTLIISIENNVNLPTAIASLENQNSPSYVMTAGVPEVITDYSSEISLYSTASIFTGVSTLIHSGVYRVITTIGGTITDEEIDITLELYDVTNSTIVRTFTFNSGRGSDPALVPFSKTLTSIFRSLVDSTEYVLRMISSTNETINLSQISFSLESVQLK